MSDIKHDETIEFTDSSDLESRKIPTNCQVLMQEKPYYAYPMRYVPWDSERICQREITERIYYSGLYSGSRCITAENCGDIETVVPPYAYYPDDLSDINTSLPDWKENYVLSPLREGWILLRRQYTGEDTPSWFEYQVLSDGSLKNIIWTDEEIGADVRYRKKENINALSFSKRAEYHVLYTEIQLSWKMYEELENDETFRNRMMQKIVPNESESSKALMSIKDCQLLRNADVYDEKLVPDTYLRRLEGDNYIIGISDIMGTADFLQGCFEEKNHQMKDLLKSLRTGRNPDYIRLERINPHYYYSSINLTEYKPTTVEQQHFTALQDITCTLNRVGWANEENSKKIGKHLDKNRMDIILGRAERDRIRDEIKEIKELYVKYLQSSPYQNHLIFHIENTPYRIMEGKSRCADHLTGITESFEAIDMFLRETEELEKIKPEEDKGYQHVKAILDDDSESMNASKLLRSSLYLDLEEDPLVLGAPECKMKPGISEIDLSVNFSLTLNTILGATQYFVTNFPDYLPVQLQFLNTNVLAGIDSPLFDLVKLGDLIDDSRTVLTTSNYPNGIFKLVNITDDIKNGARFVSTSNGILDTMQISAAKELRQAYQRNPTKFEKTIERLVETRSFKTFVAAASYLNVVLAGKEILKKENELRSKQYRDWLNFVNSLAIAWATTQDLSRLVKLNAGMITKETSKGISQNITRLSAVTCFVSAAVSGYDSYANFSEGDNDAAFAYGGAAVFSICLGIALLASNPVGWLIIVFAVLSTGCGILGSVFEDTPLENFIKNFLLQDYGGLRVFRTSIKPPTISDPWRSICEHYYKRDYLIDDKFKDWENFTHAKARLTEILYGIRLDLEKELIEGEHHWSHDLFHTKKLTVTIQLSQFKKGYSRLTHHEFYFYPNGIKNGASQKLTPRPVIELEEIVVSPNGGHSDSSETTEMTAYVIDEESNPVTAEVYYDLDSLLPLMTEWSEILFITRYQINPHITVPCSLDGVQRYIGYLEKSTEAEWSNLLKGIMASNSEGLAATIADESMLYGPKQRTGTHDELLDPLFWGRGK